MAWYKPLVFNRENFILAVTQEFDKVMEQAIKNRWEVGLDYNGEITAHFKEFNGGSYTITFNDLRAWVMFFGSGQYMEDTQGNPYLKEYIDSELWNPARRGKSVVGRPAGSYTGFNIDTGELDDDRVSGGKWMGKEIHGKFRNRKHRDVDFWGLLEMTWRDFVSLAPNAIKRIEQRVNEYMTVGTKVTV